MNRKHDGFWILLTVITLLVSCVIYDLCGNPKNTQTALIGVSEMTLNNPFYEVINNELLKQTKARGDQLLILDPMLDANRQAEQLLQMIEQQVDAIILNPVDSSALEGPLQKAKEADIPVVVIDSPIEHETLIESTIVSKNYLAGQICAKAMMDTQDSARILLLEHSQADSARDRINGFLDAMKDHPQYQVITRAECEGQLEKAMPVTTQALQKHPQIDTVMALNDPSALGACAAADVLGVTDLAIYGVDGTPDFKTRMHEDQRLKATVAQSPYTMAKKAADSVYRLLEGRPVEVSQLVDVQLIDRNSLAGYSLEGWQ